jgi:hypothetical protein
MITGDRTILIDSLQTLSGAARAERAKLPFDSAERQFYLGVEAAADALIHPEVFVAKPADWLEQESPSFRKGFLTTSSLIAGAISSPALPARLPLPSPA